MNAETARFSTWEEAVCSLRDDPDKAQIVRDAYYDDPLLDVAERYYQSGEWREVARFLSGWQGRALDIGAGRGIASYALAKEGFDVTALEPDQSMIVGSGAIRSLASETGLPIRVAEAVSERIPCGDGEFDVVFARAVLHHMSDLEAACSEIHRILKPGGVFVAAREHVLSKESDLPAFLEAHPLHNLYGGEHAFTLSRYESALTSAGFTIQRSLAPFESAINYHPRSRSDLIDDLSDRLPLGSFFRPLFRVPGLSALAIRVAGMMDSRPGRLYSFVAEKPQ